MRLYVIVAVVFTAIVGTAWWRFPDQQDWNKWRTLVAILAPAAASLIAGGVAMRGRDVSISNFTASQDGSLIVVYALWNDTAAGRNPGMEMDVLVSGSLSEANEHLAIEGQLFNERPALWKKIGSHPLVSCRTSNIA